MGRNQTLESPNRSADLWKSMTIRQGLVCACSPPQESDLFLSQMSLSSRNVHRRNDFPVKWYLRPLTLPLKRECRVVLFPWGLTDNGLRHRQCRWLAAFTAQLPPPQLDWMPRLTARGAMKNELVSGRDVSVYTGTSCPVLCDFLAKCMFHRLDRQTRYFSWISRNVHT